MVKRLAKAHDRLRTKVLSDPVCRAEYEAFKIQLDVAEQFKKARQKAHMTQDAVAEKMETQKPVVARLEAAGGKGKHSPSIKTLVRYADALGCDIQIKLVSKRKAVS